MHFEMNQWQGRISKKGNLLFFNQRKNLSKSRRILVLGFPEGKTREGIGFGGKLVESATPWPPSYFETN